MDEEISRLKTVIVGLLSDLGCTGPTITEDLINEMCRYGAAELHAVAAFVGGIASQEVIKQGNLFQCPELSSLTALTTSLNCCLCKGTWKCYIAPLPVLHYESVTNPRKRWISFCCGWTDQFCEKLLL